VVDDWLLRIFAPLIQGIDSESNVPEEVKNLLAQNVGCPEDGVVGEFMLEGRQPGPIDTVAGFLGRAQTEPLVVGHVKDEGPGPNAGQLTIADLVSQEQVVRVVVFRKGEEQFPLVSVRFPAEHLFAGLRPGLTHAEIKTQSRVEQDRPPEHHTPVGVLVLGQVVVVTLRFPPGGVALDGCRHEIEQPSGA